MKDIKGNNVAELFVKCLEKEGVQYIFGVPGEENLVFLEAIRESSIRLIITRDEQGACFMAAAVGRLTGKIGVALSTLGPGATNLMTGIAYAQLGGMPILVITGQKPLKKSKQGLFQIIDTVRMMEPLTKYTTTIKSPDRVASIVREAVKIAESERPGAVHIELPEDIASEAAEGEPIVQEKIRRPVPDEKSIKIVVDALEKSLHPVILLASGANRKLVRKQLRLFLEKTSIPFITTQMGKGVEDETSPLYMGTTALSGGDYVHKILSSADTVIVIGHDINEKPPAILTRDMQTIIHVNFSQADVDEVYIPTHEIVGDISNALWQITESITVPLSWDFSYFRSVRNSYEKSILVSDTYTSFPVRPERLVSDVRKIMPHDGILSLDNGMYKIWFARDYRAFEQNSVILDNALATMGAGLPVGIATKLLNPDKKVLVVAGDGGFMMNVAEIETAQRLGLDLVILILNDSGYGMISWKQRDMGLPDFGLAFSNPDFVILAESFGAKGYKIKNAEDLAPILRQAINSKGIHIIDCPVDYSHNVEVLGEGLRKEIQTL
ncbi:MAG: acetolactate synthase large subunit [Patescibacteria group bacterium]